MELYPFMSASFIASVAAAEQQIQSTEVPGLHAAMVVADEALGAALNRGLLRGFQLEWDRSSLSWTRFVTAIAAARWYVDQRGRTCCDRLCRYG